MRAIALILLITYSISQLLAQSTIVDLNGNELADCSCSCCAGESSIQNEKVPCSVDLILLISAAACVKDYINQIKGRASNLLEEFTNPAANYAGFQSRVGVISYSTDINNIHSLDQPKDEVYDNLANWNYTKQLNGDMLGKGLEAAFNMFESNVSQNKKALIVITNGGVNDKSRDQDVSKFTTKLRQMGVDIMAHTITEHCDVKKDCLMCCPDKHFLTSVLATSDRVCDNSFKIFDEELGYDVRLYDKNDYYIQCLKNVRSFCDGQARIMAEGNTCHRKCDCTCKQVRRGIPGLPGNKGLTGDQGPSGAAGQDGRDGLSGMPGQPGANGIPGMAGSPCLDGLDAPDGRQGPAGATGPSGAAGVDGSQGEQGIKGPAGVQGLRGNVGKPGAPGPQGPRGPAGPAGPAGPQGETGPQGCPGAQGLPGIDGAAGIAGPVGPIGRTGAPGVKGPAGAPGNPGLCGEAGPVGKAGQDGIAGYNGIPGRQGEVGEPGEKGPRGAPGKPGRMDYSRYVRIMQEEIKQYLNNYGWRFTGQLGWGFGFCFGSKLISELNSNYPSNTKTVPLPMAKPFPNHHQLLKPTLLQ